MITIEPLGGLANRMRGIDSALALSRAINVPLRVVWKRTPLLNCAFQELFQPLRSTRVIERWRGTNAVLRRIALYAKRYDKVLWDGDIVSLSRSAFDFTQLVHWRSVFIQTHSQFYRSGRPFQDFAPVEPLQRLIDGYTRRYTHHTVGVHIRRTDHKWAIAHSPTESFMELMAAEVAREPGTLFFVATDSPADEARLRREFPTRVLSHPKVLARNKPQAIRDAVVDLFCLSRTRRILASYDSSFSATAALIGGITPTVVFRMR